MSISILNLSQELSEKVNQNGDWQTNLSKEIELNEGDTVSIKNVFLDTVSISSGKIVIPENITLTINNGLYIVDWYTTNKTYVDTTQTTASYKIFTPSNYTSAAPHNDLVVWQAVIFSAEVGGGSPLCGGIDVPFTYVDINGNTQKINVSVPSFNGRSQPKITVDVGKGIICKTNSIALAMDAKKLEEEARIDVNSYKTYGKIITGSVFHPMIFETNIKLEKGSYDPTKLCQILNEQFTDLKTDSTHITNSNFLKLNGQINSGNFYYASLDGSQLFTSTDALLVGTSQLDLQFNQSTGKFEFDYLHMPYYTNSGNIAVRYENIGGTLHNTGSNGGIFFTNLSATKDSDGSYYDFWSGDLGFNLDDIIVKPSGQEFEKTIGPFVNASFHTYDLEVSKNITSGFKGLDNIVQKNSNFYKFAGLAPGSVLEDSTSTTYEIIANNSISATELDSSHYLVEIQAVMNSKFINQYETKGDISGIVSRYYNYGSFTSSGTESAITYEHRGSSVYLKSFNIRVLNKLDMTVPDNLGNRNDIYIEVIKASN